MLTFTHGNLFESGCTALVNTVNTQGVMGAGIALEFKKRFPHMFAEYKQVCGTGQLKPGEILPIKTDDLWIINFATKDHWRDPSQLEWIEHGLGDLRRWIQSVRPASIAIPALGCSLGRLSWGTVRPLIETRLSDLETRILVYEPWR